MTLAPQEKVGNRLTSASAANAPMKCGCGASADLPEDDAEAPQPLH